MIARCLAIAALPLLTLAVLVIFMVLPIQAAYAAEPPLAATTGTVPSAPAILGITSYANGLVVLYDKPEQTGGDGDAITAYDLRYIREIDNEQVDANWTMILDIWSGPYYYDLTGLANDVEYE